MALSFREISRNIWQTLSSIKTGVVLIIMVVILSAAGTVILQRPMTDAEDMQRAYSPQMLRILDATGLTDVFHTRWFVSLLILVSISIIAASVQRFPNAWRYYARPYKSPDETFRRILATKAQIPITDEERALSAADRALEELGFRPERIVRREGFSLFAERHRISEMAVYIVHTSLLLIFLGGIVDALYGWRGFLMLTPGTESAQVSVRNGTIRTLPFSIRCDGTGEETYSDGTPKRWWSKLAIVENGREVTRKEIVVNDPLVHAGIRFYQASYGSTGKLDHVLLTATPSTGTTRQPQEISLAPGQTVTLDSDTSVELAEFIPDYVVQDGHVYARSREVVNPAVRMVVTSRKTSRSVNFWLPEIPGIAENAASPYVFKPKDLKMGYYTGLQVSHEPGQWAVWSGVILMGLGLTCVFYIVHIRLWVVPVLDESGQMMLWVGGTANRNRDAFEQKFRKLIGRVQSELQPQETEAFEEQSTLFAGK